MAKKRMVTQDINFDEDFNSVSTESQLLFIRCLTIADDCGVFPANDFTLQGLINCPDKLKKVFDKCFTELVNIKLLLKFNYLGKQFYCFKKESWEENQKYLIKNRTRSEYLKIELQQFLSLYSKLQEIPVNVSDNGSYHIERIKIEIKDKEEDRDKEGKETFEENPEPLKIDFKKIPPTLEIVKQQIKERKLNVDAERFMAHYESNGWKVGKAGNKMKDWNATLTTWNSNNYNNGTFKTKPINDIQNTSPGRVL